MKTRLENVSVKKKKHNQKQGNCFIKKRKKTPVMLSYIFQ